MRACANFNTNKENGKWLRATLLQYLGHFFPMFWLRVCRFLTWTLNENIMYIKLGPKSNFAVIIKQRHYFFFLSFCKHASRVSVQGCGMYLKLLRRQILLATQKILSPCRIYNDNLKKKFQFIVNLITKKLLCMLIQMLLAINFYFEKKTYLNYMYLNSFWKIFYSFHTKFSFSRRS